MSLARLWAILAVALPGIGALLAGLSTTDLAYHLRAGGDMLDGLGIPRTDTWTYTVAGRPWHDQQWLAQVALAGVYRLGGWVGLAVLRALLVGAIFGLVALAARRRGADARTATILAIAAFVVSAVALALRPQLLGMLLFAVVLLVVVERHRRPSWLLTTVPITIVWANLHGSFVMAPLLLGLAWVEDVVEGRPTPHRMLIVAIAAAVAAVVNPWGLDVWTYAIGLMADPSVTARVTEWQPTGLRDVPGVLFFVSACAMVVLLARRGRTTSWPTLLLLGVFFALGVYAVRGVAWWPLVAAIAAAGLLPVARSPTPTDVSRPVLGRLNAAVVGAVAVGGVLAVPWWRPIDPGLQAPAGLLGQAPSGITAALRELVRDGDRIFAPQPWGSWLEFALPQATVAVDSRIELFPDGVWAAHDRILSGGEGWLEALDQWGVTVVVAGGEDELALAERLQRAGWCAVYSDDDGAVLIAEAVQAARCEHWAGRSGGAAGLRPGPRIAL